MFILSILVFNIVLICSPMINAKSINEGAAGAGEISRNMCKKYNEYAKTLVCPFSSEDVGTGVATASEKEFPHMVLLGYRHEGKINWSCGAALISDQYVICAAHCLKSPRGDPEVVRIGVTDIEGTSHLQEIKVKEVKVHPDFNPPTRYNDIGLVKLEKKIDINEHARPACLNTLTEIEDSRLIHSGWGVGDVDAPFEEKLSKLILEPTTQEKCNKFYENMNGSKQLPNGITYDSLLCAASTSAGPLQIRSGGALQVQQKTEDGKDECLYNIVGIDSFGQRIIKKDEPEVYTRVSSVIPWIEEIVWENEK